MDIKLTIRSKVCLSHLSIQKDGNKYTIGEKNIPKFIRVPEAAVLAVSVADGSRSIEEIKTALMREHEIDVDMEDFFTKLLAIGLVKSVDDIVLVSESPPSPSHERIVKISKLLFNSWTAKLFAFNAIVVLLLFSAKPALLPTFKDIFVLSAIGINELMVMGITCIVIVLHEGAHYMCSYSKGIKATIRLSRRFIFIAAETKMTGLWSKPKKERYFPYLAGMAWDATLILFCLLVQIGLPDHSLLVMMARLVVLLLFTGILGQLLPKAEKTASVWFSLIYVCGIGIVTILFVSFTFPAFLEVVSRAYNEIASYPIASYLFWGGMASFSVIAIRLVLFLVGSRNTYLDKKSGVKRIRLWKRNSQMNHSVSKRLKGAKQPYVSVRTTNPVSRICSPAWPRHVIAFAPGR
ncbi:hypothetical protein [Paenibacillus ginsengarvi]|uniref:PqqD family protein n=1 Tax=Paenibacillus ginsengarvi TaxID=400777 RepID=A0A3B0CN76_9BACL|nr:hypothetical protein [Paenibacillus ginsengarvi]RKN86198.1 hypothetical protein D7M11_04085 [Paenibacillus ginsengarvi]